MVHEKRIENEENAVLYFNCLPVFAKYFSLSTPILTYPNLSAYLTVRYIIIKFPIFSSGENIPALPQIILKQFKFLLVAVIS